ncbi:MULTISPECIES: hypothetical protein [unclassified Streptomyces]|uniref:hypothetical protein n=1 Tax=unclassified Streptomyces TaxID=2593676 RepID=UPI0036EBC799
MSASLPSDWSLPKPMRAVPVNDPTLPAGWAAQPKADHTNIATALRHHARDISRPLATLGIT